MQGLHLYTQSVILVALALAVLSEAMAPTSVVDLVQNVDWGYSSVKPIPGSDGHSTAYQLQGPSRSLLVSNDSALKIKQLLSTTEEFVIAASVRQEERTSGAILSFMSHRHRLLEVESSGRRDELRLHYSSGGRTLTETFPYKIADGQWHKVALAFSRTHVEIYIDCNKIYERSMRPLDRLLDRLTDHSVDIWLGQRNSRHAYFKGALEYVKITGSTQGLLEQCPFANVACPSCSQFTNLEYSVKHLYQQLETLTKKLHEAEKRIADLEQCECQKSCSVNGTTYMDGNTWRPDQCTKCSCHNGQARCLPETCPPIACKNPTKLDGQCCPICLKHCFVRGTYYDHGEGFSPRTCVQCVCQDGKMSCQRQDRHSCPRLSCPRHHQFSVPGQCCKYCRGTDYCSLGVSCDRNATCVNLATRHKCQCNQGYVGNGLHCQDRDECATHGGRHGQHCGSNAKCINVPGSYTCECLPGFSRVDGSRCEEKDECLGGDHNCSEHGHCTNTHGSYKCSCKPGYSGDGHVCKPVCLEQCKNGGECVAPGKCRCRKGFLGRSCENDLDECALEVTKCPNNSRCVNLPGSYYCRCEKGFNPSSNNKHGFLCLDIDECSGWGGGHDCPVDTVCRNTVGGYQCVCPDEHSCTGGCKHEDNFYQNEAVWSPDNHPCTLCSCQSGTAQCTPKPCDCNDKETDVSCCPQCDKSKCRHQDMDLEFYHEDTWTYQCQTCQCLNGETDCWSLECPKLTCDETIQLDGDCCPHCASVDPCHADTPLLGSRHVCFFGGQNFRPGDTWLLRWDPCTSCQCKAGHVCCEYDQTCSARTASRSTALELRPQSSSLHKRGPLQRRNG